MSARLTIEGLNTRAATIGKWLEDQSSAELGQQKHLDRNTAECAYWHLGYQQALNDAAAMLRCVSPEADTAGMPS